MTTYSAEAVANTGIQFVAGVDTLNFASGSASQLVFNVSGSDLLLGLNTATIRLLGFNYAGLLGSSLVFADNSQFRIGGSPAEFLFGATGNDYVDTGGGNDTLQGEAGNDYLNTGAGDDLAFGGDGEDTLVGGAGRDTLLGEAGNDTYLISTRTSYIDDSAGADIAIVSADFVKLPATIEQVQYINGAQALPYWIDALLPDAANGLDFQGILGDSRVLNFAFPTTMPAYNPEESDAQGFMAFNAAQQAFARQALIYVATIVDIDFVETTTVDAVNTIAFANNAQDGSVGYAYFPSPNPVGSDVFLDNDTPANLAPADGDYSALTLIHEIGHALGLEHPFVAGSDAPHLIGSEDNTAWTVMSYTSAPEQFHLAYGPLDIAALQYMYGPNPASRSDDDTYVTSASTANFIWDGTGTDTLSAAGLSQAVTLFLEPGYWGHVGTKAATITAAGQVTVNFGTVLENLIGGSGHDMLVGSSLANQISGGAGNDTIDGGAGADSMAGGGGDDTYLVDQAGDVVTENDASLATGGTDTVSTSITYALPAQVENGRIITSGASGLTGNALDNLLVAGAGDNTLDGAAGQDTASYLYAGGGVTISLALAGAQSTGASGNDTLVNVEHLGGSDFNDTLFGSASANRLEGLGGNDILSGGTGADTLVGGDGNDAYYVDDPGDVVIETSALPAGGTDTVVSTVTYSAGSHIENILFTGAAGTTGIGNSLANYIEGNAAQNYLFGGAGTDTLKGNDGNDIYYVDASTDVVIETNALAAGGTDTVVSTVTYTLGANLEQLLLSGNAAITGIGNATANYIEGNSAQNYLSGGAGSDTLKGNDGNDVYYVDVSTDVVIETNADTVSGGVDFVVSTVTYQLGANVENLLLSGTDPITGIGSAVNNYIEGNSAQNYLSGGLGADTMKGNDGNDVYYVDNTGDVVIETNAVLATGGRDTVSSSIAYALGANVEDLLLTGNAAIGGLGNGLANYMTGNKAANALSGQDGNDTLIGGTGTDTLTGGLGADTFDFNTLLDSLVGASRDIITDFSSAQGDKVDLAGIDANALLANEQAFSFIGAAAFSSVAGQLRFASNLLAGDTDGNGIADFEVQLTGVPSLIAADLFL